MAKTTTKPAKASAKKTTVVKTKKKVTKPAPRKAKKIVAKKVKKAAPKKAVKKTAPKKVARKVSTRKKGKPIAKAVVNEQTEFDIVLISTGPNKMGVIKAVREITALGLQESKTVVSGKLPVVIKEAVSKRDADNIAAKIADAGAIAEIR